MRRAHLDTDRSQLGECARERFRLQAEAPGDQCLVIRQGDRIRPGFRRTKGSEEFGYALYPALSLELFDLLHRVQATLGCERPYEIISGYRCPATNQRLRETRGGGVASRSLHMDGRAIDVVIVNTARPSEEILARYRPEHKHPLEIGDIPSSCEVVAGEFWTGEIARHDRRRLATAVWAVLARRLL